MNVASPSVKPRDPAPGLRGEFATAKVEVADALREAKLEVADTLRELKGVRPPRPKLASSGRLRGGSLTESDRNYAIGMHLSPLVLSILGLFPLSLLAPLVIWLVRRRESVFDDDHGREIINFILSFLLWHLITGNTFVGVWEFAKPRIRRQRIHERRSPSSSPPRAGEGQIATDDSPWRGGGSPTPGAPETRAPCHPIPDPFLTRVYSPLLCVPSGLRHGLEV